MRSEHAGDGEGIVTSLRTLDERPPLAIIEGMKVAIIPVTPLQQNCSPPICVLTLCAAVVDPRGDHATRVRSIRTQRWPLGNEVAFIPGHGPRSSFGKERESNPFVRAGA